MKLSKIASILLSSSVFIVIGCGVESNTNNKSSSTNNIQISKTNVSGTVVDGPIYNAKVCVDYNFNSKCDKDEPSAISDINGSYTLNNVDLTQNAPLIVVPQSTSIDVSTAKPFNKILSAPLDGNNVNINPLTTIAGAKIYDLYKEGNLSKESINEVEKEVSKTLGVNDLTSINILENPTLYAKAVAIAQILPDSNSSIESLNEKIDFNKIKEGDFTDAIKDTTIRNILSNLNNIDINDSTIIQTAIESAIENNQTNISNIVEIGLKEILVKNVFYKQDEDGLPIVFDKNNSYFNINTDENETGNWKIEGDKIILDSTDGSETNITLKSVNAYIYKVEGKKLDTNKTIETFEVKVLAIPKDINGSNIDKLPGIIPLTYDDIAGKVYYDQEDGTYMKFDRNGTYEEIDKNGNVKYTTQWKINNGVLEFEGKDENDSWLVNIVRFGDYLFALIVKDNKITKGYILPIEELKTNVELPNNNTVNTTYPIAEKIGNVWGYNWYKIDAFYNGDTRFKDNNVSLCNNNECIYLIAYKKDNQDSRAQIGTGLNNVSGFSAKVNLLTDGEYSYFQTYAISKGNINTSEVLDGLDSNKNLTFIAGLNIEKNKIRCWWEIGNNDKDYAKTVGEETYNYDLTNLTDKSDVRVEINSNDSNITYKVIRLDTNETIFDKTLNISDTKITNFHGFNIASFVSRVSDDKANKNGEEAINKSENIINDFWVNNTNNNTNISVDDFLNKLNFTPISITTNTVANKLVIMPENEDDLDYFDDNDVFHSLNKGKWDEYNYSVEKNILIVDPNDPAYIAFKDINGSYGNVGFYYRKDGLQYFSVLLVNANQNTTITNSDDFINTMDSNTPLDQFGDISGQTWKVDKESNLTVTFNNDNTFSMSNNISGNWSLEKDNKVLHLNITNEPDNVHIKNIFAVKVGDYVFYIMTDDEDKIIKANGFTLN